MTGQKRGRAPPKMKRPDTPRQEAGPKHFIGNSNIPTVTQLGLVAQDRDTSR
jgi:hypothetical protein